MIRPPQSSTLFPYTTLFRSVALSIAEMIWASPPIGSLASLHSAVAFRAWRRRKSRASQMARSEEHTSELQSRRDLVCRLLLEKKKTKKKLHLYSLLILLHSA